MNILLLNPFTNFLLGTFQNISLPEIPLNLAYVAAVLENQGHNVRILDLNVITTKKELKTFLQGEIFDIIGISSTTPVIENCFRTIKVMKHLYPNAVIIIGGWHASSLPTQTLEDCEDIDFVVKGEGEETIKELVQAIEKGNGFENIKGIVFRAENGEPRENEDRPLIKNLDQLPFPAQNLLPLEKYKKHGCFTPGGYYKKDLFITSIFTSRGCSNRCIFCADHVIYKETCRFRSAENIILEIEETIRKLNIRIFMIYDADFLGSPNRVEHFCRLIIEKKIKILWGCQARVEHVSMELLNLMKASGCIRISYGIESGSPRILKLIKKNITISQIKKAISLTKAAGIPVYMYLIYGIPGETIEDMKLTRQLLFELKPDFMAQPAVIPYPGTDLYETAFHDGIIKKTGWDAFSYFFNKVLDIPDAKKLYNYQRKMERDFYTSPFYLINTIKHMKSIYQLWFYFNGLMDFIKFFLFK